MPQKLKFCLTAFARYAARGITVIVVEHNMDLVMNVADRIMVMEYGRHLFQGSPSEVQKNPAVIAAYLGGELS